MKWRCHHHFLNWKIPHLSQSCASSTTTKKWYIFQNFVLFFHFFALRTSVCQSVKDRTHCHFIFKNSSHSAPNALTAFFKLVICIYDCVATLTTRALTDCVCWLTARNFPAYLVWHQAFRHLSAFICSSPRLLKLF